MLDLPAPQSTPEASGQSQHGPSESQRKRQAKAWKAKLASADSERRSHIESITKVHRIISGKADADVKAQLEKLGAGKTWASYPKLHSYILALIPNIMRFQPVQRLRPADPSSAFERGFAANMTQYLKSAQTENRILKHAQVAVYEAIIGGVGCLISGYDAQAGRTYSRAFHAKDLLWDTQGSAIPGSMKWLGREVIFPIAQARKMFNKPDLKANTGTSKESEAMADTLGEFEENDAHYDHQDPSGGSSIKVAVIYQRGGSPYDEDQPISHIFDPEKPADDGDAYSDRDRILYFRSGSWELLGEKPWDFVLDRDEFPITLITPTIDPENVWAYAAVDPLIRIQEIIDVCLSFNVNRGNAVSKDLYIARKNSGISEEELRAAIESPKDRKVVFMDGTQYDPEDVVHRVITGDLSESMQKMIQIMDSIFRDVTNYDNLKANGGGSETATEAEIGQERLQAGLANYSSAIEEGFKDCARKESQLALNFMSGEEMARITGSLVGRELLPGQYEYWPEDPTPRMIRGIDVWVEPGSADASSNAEKARAILQLSGRVNEAMGVMANIGMMPSSQAAYEMTFGPIIEAAKLMGLDAMIESIPGPEHFQAIPQEAPAQAAPA